MAKKISQMNEAMEIKSDDISIIVQDGETKKFNINLLSSKSQIDEYKKDVENQLSTYEQEIVDIKNQYDKELYSPEISVTEESIVKTGQGDNVDYSANIEDGIAKSAILKGDTKYRDNDTGEILESFEEGRNLELVSVKMPVLTTTGKNLFNVTNVECNDNSFTIVNLNNSNYFETETLVEEGKQYTLSLNVDISGNTGNILALGYMNYSNIVGGVKASHNIVTIDSEINKFLTLTFVAQKTDYVKIYIATGKSGYVATLSNVQLEESSTATSYEPYKTNILSTPEDLELGSVGDTKDELNMITRELIQRTSIRDYIDGDESDSTVITDMTNTRYILSAPTTSTIDLTPSGTLASGKPYMWKNGSIQLSSDGLIPDLDYSVIISRVGVIESNMQETIQNEKRIHSLEVLLAQATINSAYDTVSLQSDVEVSTMSLSLDDEVTQNEPDDFLYEMILLLIENNAYNDNLFEKVSVFYLYGKLSDEQFMNIYNLLYVEE